MNNFTLVRPEHLNYHGYLFGGMILKWVDGNGQACPMPKKGN